MSLSKRFTLHERESLYSGANSAIWHSHRLATQLASSKAREEDYVATLVTDGIPLLADRWKPLLQGKGIELKLSGVYCHGHPQVAFGTPRCQVELADLLIVHQHVGKDRSSARAILLQAKMSTDSTHVLPSNDAQLQLFSKWPQFEFVTGGLKSGLRNLNEKGKGSRYALVLDKHSYPEDILWADQCPWGASTAAQHLSVDRSLAKLLGDILLGKDGRTFQLGRPKDDWSRTVQELLEVTGRRTYKRTSIKRGDTPRFAGDPSTLAGLMFISSTASIGAVTTRKKADSINDRYFGSVAMVGSNGDERDHQFNEDRNQLEGGISALIIETAEIDG